MIERTYTQADLDAAVAAALEDAIKPLDWQPTRDAAGHDYGVMVAECPVTGGRIWAEGPENRERQEAMYRKNVRAALIESPPDARATLKTRDQAMIAEGMRRAADALQQMADSGHDFVGQDYADAIRAEAKKMEKGEG